ncbi:MAG: hypothetical protein ACLT76_01560 [Clostridium fessum]
MDIVSMKNEKGDYHMCWSWGNGCGHRGGCGGLRETMDGAGIAVEIMEEIPIGEVSTMVMPSATGMRYDAGRDSQSGCGCSNNGGCGCGN